MAKRAHFDAIDTLGIEAKFSRDKRFRYFLKLPFKGRKNRPFLGILGQNPSMANATHADPTIRYLAEYAWRHEAGYGGLTVFNLFARIDTKKTESDALNSHTSERILRGMIRAHQDILVVTGKLVNQRAYRFKERMQALKPLLAKQQLLKFALDTDYAPHPGNTHIFYHNYDVALDTYHFTDLG
jgi:hypothetical protein